MSKIVKISWQRYAEDIQKLTSQINGYQKSSKIKFNRIFPIIRGGLVIGVNLSYLLGISKLNFNLSKLLYILNGDKENILIVDDVSDSGDTLTALTKFLKAMKINFKVATLYVKDKTKFYPDFWIRKYNNDIWLHFPWENTKVYIIIQEDK